MISKEARKLVWDWMAIAMEQATMSWDYSDLLLGKEWEQVPSSDREKLKAAWRRVRAQVKRNMENPP